MSKLLSMAVAAAFALSACSPEAPKQTTKMDEKKLEAPKAEEPKAEEPKPEEKK